MLRYFSHVQLFATLWALAHQAPLSMGFSRQEYWNGLPCPSLGDPPDPGIKPASLISSALKGRFFTTSTTNDLSSLCVPNNPTWIVRFSSQHLTQSNHQ